MNQKYPRTPHFEEMRSNIAAIARAAGATRIVIEEKLDGTNAGIQFSPDGDVLTRSRGNFLMGGYREKQFDMFRSWADWIADDLIDRIEDRHIVYLRASYGDINGGAEGWVGFMKRHRNLITRELQAEHPDRVREKYEWLRTYHNDTVASAPIRFLRADGHDPELGEIQDSPEWSWLKNVRSELLVPETS